MLNMWKIWPCCLKSWDKDKDKGKRKRSDNDNKRSNKHSKKEETNEGEEEEEVITLNVEEQTQAPQEESEASSRFFDASEEGQYYNFNSDNTYNMHAEINEPVCYYDCFADSATSSHVTNKRDIFITYQPLHNMSVVGVGRLKAKAKGRGTIKLESRFNNKIYILRLKNVLHIPTNKNNLISLGKWDTAGGRYIGGGGKIILEDKHKTAVAIGMKIDNNLYKMKLKTCIPCENNIKTSSQHLQAYTMTESTQNWETWHKRYGHVGYTGLQKLLDHKMVNGLTVDTNSTKPDCETCIQAKLGFRTGNPGVFRRYPYPNPSLPIPMGWGTGLSVNGSRVLH
jgi:Pol polyprotein/gag-pre-integrase-like protein